MSTHHHIEEPVPAASNVEVTSPTRQHNATPTQSTHQMAPVSGPYRLHAETPSIQLVPEILNEESDDLPAAWNLAHNLRLTLREEGNLVWAVPRRTIKHKPKQVVLSPEGLWYGAKRTIRAALDRYFRLKTGLSDADYESRADAVSTQLANGCSLTTYMKVRAIVITHAVDKHNIRMPRVESTNQPIPKAFAFAIQQLGIINVIDTVDTYQIMPVFPDSGHKSGIPTELNSWNPTKYSEAVEYVRRLGMQFAVVDVTVKGGNAWWLLRQKYSDEVFDLSCILPETNYTDTMTVATMLYCHGDEVDPSNAIADLSEVDTGMNYGIVLTNPHPGFNVTAFQALSHPDADVLINT